jgi:hypothetical protein
MKLKNYIPITEDVDINSYKLIVNILYLQELEVKSFTELNLKHITQGIFSKLGISGCKVTDLDGLPEIIHSRMSKFEINIRECTQLRSISGLPDGYFLNIEISDCRNLVSLEGCPSAETIRINNCGIRSLAGMGGDGISSTIVVERCNDLTSLDGCPPANRLMLRECDNLHTFEGLHPSVRGLSIYTRERDYRFDPSSIPNGLVSLDITGTMSRDRADLLEQMARRYKERSPRTRVLFNNWEINL